MLAVLTLLAGLGFPTVASAHNQPGPPYVVVNGAYAETNPFSANYPDDVPQDFVAAAFKTGQTINFSIDESRLAQPAEFRWQWDAAKANDTTDGMKAGHSFSTPGAHVVVLLSKSDATGGQFTAYDTILINVGTHANYHPPKVRITASSQREASGKQTLTYHADVTADSSAKIDKIYWRFGDGLDTGGNTGGTITHTYDPAINSYFPIAVVRDSNGVTTIQGFQTDIDSQKAVVHDYPSMPGTVKVSSGGGNWWSLQSFLLGGTAALAAIIGFRFYRQALKKRR